MLGQPAPVSETICYVTAPLFPSAAASYTILSTSRRSGMQKCVIYVNRTLFFRQKKKSLTRCNLVTDWQHATNRPLGSHGNRAQSAGESLLESPCSGRDFSGCRHRSFFMLQHTTCSLYHPQRKKNDRMSKKRYASQNLGALLIGSPVWATRLSLNCHLKSREAIATVLRKKNYSSWSRGCRWPIKTRPKCERTVNAPGCECTESRTFSSG